MYCPRCGKGLPEGAEFCPNCGAAVKAEGGLRGTVVGRIGRDRFLQQHWIRRVVAVVVDFIIVGFATVMVLVAVFFPWFLANPFGFLIG